MKKVIIIEIIALLLSILFIYAGISKLMEYDVFKEQLSSSPILQPISPFLAILLPAIELFLVLLLLVPRWRIKGLYFSLALLILFTGYIITIILYSEELPCSCGGILSELSWAQHILFNAGFIAMTIAGICIEHKKRKETQWIPIAQNS
jgi:uncharacterized membrane protein YphA (DoxX/SURF4 family)